MKTEKGRLKIDVIKLNFFIIHQPFFKYSCLIEIKFCKLL